MDVKDDEYFAILPDGKRVKLIRIGNHSSNNFKLETEPYWLVTRSMLDGEITGWILVSSEGVTYKFGQLENGQFVKGFGSDPAYSANHCTHRYGNWIGNGTATSPSALSYQWNITRIIDVTGKTEMQFSYYQELETIQGINYTRASYLDYIIDSMGRKIKFVRGSRNANEYQDLAMSFEMKQYEKKFLDLIHVFSDTSESTRLLTVDFEYGFLGAGTKYKRMLHEIVFTGQSSNTLPSLEFSYAQGAGKPLGALEWIKLPDGGSRTIQYVNKQNNYLDQTTDADAVIQQQTSDPGPSDCNQSGSAQPAYFDNSNTVIAFIDPEEGFLHVHKWNGQSWVSASYDGYGGGGWSNNHELNQFSLSVNDRSVAVGKRIKNGSNKMIEVVVYNWNEIEQSWPLTPVVLYPAANLNDDTYVTVAMAESKLVFDIESHLSKIKSPESGILGLNPL